MTDPQPVAGRRARWALGLAVLGRPAYINTGSSATVTDRTVEALQDNTFAVLDAAMAAGIDWVDAARSYGLAEQFLGRWFAARRPDPAPTVSTKWGYAYVGGWRTDAEVHEVKEHSLERFRSQWRESRAELDGVIGLYQVHSLTPDSPLFEDRGLLAAMAGLADDGVAVGFSTSGPRQAETIRRALRLWVDGRGLFSAVQATWNLYERSAGEALAEAGAAGLTVMVKESLANGRLATEPPDALRELAERAQATVDAVALAAVAAQPWVDRVVLGPADTDQLVSNLQADLVRLDDADLDRLAGLAQDPDTYWTARAALPWH